MSIERSVDIVVDVKGIQEALDDGEVRGVDAGGRVVLVGEAVEESSEYWIVVLVSRRFLGSRALMLVIPLPTALSAFASVPLRTALLVRYCRAQTSM